MTTALIIVDLQRDFIDGALGGPDRDRVIEPLVRAAEKADVVAASLDWHPENHFSFTEQPQFRDGSWPIHCVAGTPGAEPALEIDNLDPVMFFKGEQPDTEAYSAFDATNEDEDSLDEWLRMKEVDTVEVGGLCTDYCVRATALDATRLGYHVKLLLAGCAGVAEETTAAAIEEMRQAGVEVVD